MDKHTIIQMHLSDTSNREIARRLGVDRKTINKYVNEYESLHQQLVNTDKDDIESLREIAEGITSPPQYKKRKSASRKWNQEMQDFLEDILAKEVEKQQILHTKKQNLTNIQIHELFIEKGFDISYPTICQKLAQIRKNNKEVFIAQSHPYGKRFDYDFGEVKLEIASKFTHIQMAVMSAPASGYRYALLYYNQKKDVFLDSQVRFFEHLGGCFDEGVYDNMRNVVTKFIGKNEKELNEDLIGLSSYYGFKINVTNCFRGNEKGSVEQAVKFIRNKAFATKWKFESLAEAQAHLNKVLDRLNQTSTIEEEKKFLKAIPAAFEVADIRSNVLVDKLSCVRVDRVSYSVPESYCQRRVCVKAYPNNIVIVDKGKVIASHLRSTKAGDMVLDIKHYLHTFLKKPGAICDSTALKANTRLKAIFDTYYKDNPRQFASILLEYKDQSLDCAIEALLAISTEQTNAKTVQNNKIAMQTLAQIALISSVKRGV